MGVRHSFRLLPTATRMNLIPAQGRDDDEAMVNLKTYNFYIHTFSQK
jgi:hypothetical protein